MNLFDLSEEVAVVIGGTGVLGGAVAEGLASSGARVVIAGRNLARGAERVAAVIGSGGSAVFAEVNASSRESVQNLQATVKDTYGHPTILVNAAGGNDPSVTVTPENPFEGISVEDWVANFDLNLIGGTLLPCQVFGPGMVSAKRGSIINIASVFRFVWF